MKVEARLDLGSPETKGTSPKRLYDREDVLNRVGQQAVH